MARAGPRYPIGRQAAEETPKPKLTHIPDCRDKVARRVRQQHENPEIAQADPIFGQHCLKIREKE
jgi:hypothetical protein